MLIRKIIVTITQFIVLSVFRLFIVAFASRDIAQVLPKHILHQPHIIAANHKMGLDSLVLLLCLPYRSALKMMPVSIMVLNVFYDSPFLRPGLWISGGFPAHNKKGNHTFYGTAAANALLDNGFSMHIFPEGKRIKKDEQPKSYPGVIVSHQAFPSAPIVLCNIDYDFSLKAFLQRRVFVTNFALETDISYTDSKELMNSIYRLSGTK